MTQVLHAPLADASAEAHRQAYNAAFEELGLNWHWDPATFARLPAHGREGVRAYLQSEHPHLLRAYDADFLADAIETAKARYYATIAGNRAAAGRHAGRAAASPARTHA
jgi:hypothetical protein